MWLNFNKSNYFELILRLSTKNSKMSPLLYVLSSGNPVGEALLKSAVDS